MSKYIKAIDEEGNETFRRDFSDWDFRRCIALCLYGAKMISGERLHKEFFETKDLQYFSTIGGPKNDSNIESITDVDMDILDSAEHEFIQVHYERDENLLRIGSRVNVPMHITDKLNEDDKSNFTNTLKAITKNAVSTEMLLREVLPPSFASEVVDWCSTDDKFRQGKLPEILNLGALNLVFEVKRHNENGTSDSVLSESLEMWTNGSPTLIASFSAVLMEIVQNDGRYKMG